MAVSQLAAAKARKIGLIIDDAVVRHHFTTAIAASTHHLQATIDIGLGLETLESLFGSSKASEIDVWLVNVMHQHAEAAIDMLLEQCEKPVLIEETIPDISEHSLVNTWQRRLLEKIAATPVVESLIDSREKPAEHIWVLAASLGGPEMVQRFLRNVPPGLPVCFVYVQHIAAQFDQFLTTGSKQLESYPLKLIDQECLLTAGQTWVVPADKQLQFSACGGAIKTDVEWQGPYQPSIDYVVSSLAKLYRKQVGLIVFSGTCDDGKIGCRVLKSCGGKVWVQQPETCMSSAMPEAALATNTVSYQASPELLAAALAGILTTKGIKQEALP